MHILFLADVPAADPVSGSEQVVYQQAVALAQKGHKVKLITRQASMPNIQYRRIAPNVEEGVFGADPRKIGQFCAALCRFPGKIYNEFYRDGSFDVVICHQPFVCLPLLISGVIKRIPAIYVFHSPGHEEYLLLHRGGGMLTQLNALFRRHIERVCVRRAVRVVTLSRFMAEKARAVHKIPFERIKIIPGGADLKRFVPLNDRLAMKKTLGLPPHSVHLLTVRNIEPRMGIENLVAALGILKKKGFALHLTIGGDGVDREKIQQEIDRKGLGDVITMTGFIAAEQLAHYYGAADFFVIPTQSLEGFGLVTTEALACGTPVLGTPVGGTQEILSGFDRDFLFENSSPEAISAGIEQKIRLYSSNPECYDALRVRCREYAARNYSWRNHTECLQKILQEIV